MKRIVNYLSEVRLELAKVVWPKKEEVVKLTLIVFATSAIIGGFIGIVDFGFTKLIEVLLVL